jgi:hypothetical protein
MKPYLVLQVLATRTAGGEDFFALQARTDIAEVRYRDQEVFAEREVCGLRLKQENLGSRRRGQFFAHAEYNMAGISAGVRNQRPSR